MLTALEVSTYCVDFGPLFMPVLLILMIIKFFTVVAVLHAPEVRQQDLQLRCSTRACSSPIFVYCGALATFQFFWTLAVRWDDGPDRA